MLNDKSFQMKFKVRNTILKCLKEIKNRVRYK